MDSVKTQINLRINEVWIVSLTSTYTCINEVLFKINFDITTEVWFQRQLLITTTTTTTATTTATTTTSTITTAPSVVAITTVVAVAGCVYYSYYYSILLLLLLWFGWLCWGLTSQSTIFQSCRDGAIASWVINQYFRGVKCLAQGHNTAAVGLEPRTSRSGVRHSTTEPPRSPYYFEIHETYKSNMQKRCEDAHQPAYPCSLISLPMHSLCRFCCVLAHWPCNSRLIKYICTCAKNKPWYK